MSKTSRFVKGKVRGLLKVGRISKETKEALQALGYVVIHSSF